MSRILVDQVRSNSASGDAITLDGSGKCAINATTINNLTFPTSDGSADQLIKTNGSGALSFGTVSADTKFTHFRIHTGWSGGADPITNWDKLDNIGDLITESSGTFSFAQTGYYRVLMQIYCYHNADNDNIQMEITKTANNSSYSTASRSYSHMNNDDGGNLYTMVQMNTTLDITDTTNMKIRFRSMNTSVNFHASAYHDESYAIFTRLGDT